MNFRTTSFICSLLTVINNDQKVIDQIKIILINQKQKKEEIQLQSNFLVLKLLHSL